jgi:asparagine synthase (glutamine-hydrolysing)
MCGFAGFVSSAARAGDAPDRVACLRAMGRQLSRRGPDDEQLLVDEHLALVFRRLSVVDCAGGRQPIPNEDGTLFVAVNGEIYNHADLRATLKGPHRFRTRSDSEVVLHLFEEQGPAALDGLIGMFAIAIWDTRAHRLFLARDRLGIKPLYISRLGGDLLFGSELKALLVHPACARTLNWHDCRETPGRLATFVSDIDCLPGGHYLTWSPDGGVATRCYWNLDEAMATPDTGRPAAHYVERFADLLEDSVTRRLMSDVPVGAFLSGGLDSATIVSVAASQGQALPCFTMLERSTWLCGDAQAAADIAALLKVPFYPVLYDHEALVAQLQLGLGDLEYFVWLMDRPTFTLEFLFKHELHRFAKTVIPDLKVILIGQGADEFAGGYSNSVYTPHADWNDYLARAVMPLWKAQRCLELGIPELLQPTLAPEAYGPAPEAPFRAEMAYRLRTLQTYNLWHEDRTSCGQGVEARVPFLDHRLVELLASVPGRLHAELFWDKELIRRAARRWLPEAFVRRRKVPFVYGPERGSTVDFMYRWITRAFPAFREKYLEGPDRLFEPGMLARILRYAGDHPERRERILETFVNCMGLSIFSRLCAEGSGQPPEGWRPPSSLRVCDVHEVPWSPGSQGTGAA